MSNNRERSPQREPTSTTEDNSGPKSLFEISAATVSKEIHAKPINERIKFIYSQKLTTPCQEILFDNFYANGKEHLNPPENIYRYKTKGMAPQRVLVLIEMLEKKNDDDLKHYLEDAEERLVMNWGETFEKLPDWKNKIEKELLNRGQRVDERRNLDKMEEQLTSDTNELLEFFDYTSPEITTRRSKLDSEWNSCSWMNWKKKLSPEELQELQDNIDLNTPLEKAHEPSKTEEEATL